MLEMMPGSIVDKTNNNLSNLVCAHSTIKKQHDLGKENIMEVAEKVKESVSCPNLQENCKFDCNINKETSDCSLLETECNYDVKILPECNIVNQETIESNDIVDSTTVAQEILENTPITSKFNLECQFSEDISRETPEYEIISETIDCNIISNETIENSSILEKTNDSEINKCSLKTEQLNTNPIETALITNSDQIFDVKPKETIDSNTETQETIDSNSESQEIVECIFNLETIDSTSNFETVASNTNLETCASSTNSETFVSDTNSETIASTTYSDCNIVFEEIVNLKETFEDEIVYEKTTASCYIDSKETVDSNIVSQKTIDSETVSQETVDSEIVSQGTIDPEIVSEQNTEYETIEEATEFNIDSNTVSQETVGSETVSKQNTEYKTIEATTEFNIDSNSVSQETIDSETVSKQNTDNETIEETTEFIIDSNETLISSVSNSESHETIDCSANTKETSESNVSTEKNEVSESNLKETSEVPEENETCFTDLNKLIIYNNIVLQSFQNNCAPEKTFESTSESSQNQKETLIITSETNDDIKETTEALQTFDDAKIIQEPSETIDSKETIDFSNSLETIDSKIVEDSQKTIENTSETNGNIESKDSQQNPVEIIIESNPKIKKSKNILKLSLKQQLKLETFLTKHNLTINDLLPKLKQFKRLTKDRRKQNCVLSLKINKYYFKSVKPKWSKRIFIKNKKILNTYLKKRKQYTQIKTVEAKSSEETIGSQENIVVKSDEDIREQIKKQLELLRQNKKQSSKTAEDELTTNQDQLEIKESQTDENSKPGTSKTVESSLDGVLLSKGDLGISIVSVVGGYISDEEEKTNKKQPEIVETKEKTNKGISMTDILLQRDFTSCDPNLIRLTKTNDITKIKGWRTKQFATVKTPESAAEPEKDKTTLPTPQHENIMNTIQNPVAGTSFGYNDPKIPNLKPDNILKQGENKNDKTSKSAFVSDVLDTFLTNHAQLKISYEVPKLVAEEAISKPKTEMPVSNNDYLAVVNKTSYRSNIANKISKPKTLAEKRRMLEKDRQNQLLHDMEINEGVYLKQLEYCEKRNKNETAKNIRENIISKGLPFSRNCWNVATKIDENARQFVLVNGNKIRILGSSGGKDIIVNSPKKTNPKKIAYKPGPLSKKYKLITCHKNWECRVLKMPKIKLVVLPEPGKRLPEVAEQYIQLYRGEKGYISNELAEFAAFAVRTPKLAKNKFEFDIPYKNEQNKLLVRKQKYNITSHDRLGLSNYSNINVDDCIKSIMSNMLNCVENQSLDKYIIKNDPDFVDKTDENIQRPISPIDPMIHSIIKRPNAKRSRTSRELRRLNVQIIEVDVKEESNIETCSNEFCQLGCVCASLRGASNLVPEHCGRVNCMLECTCAFENAARGTHSITLPAGTDVLSASTVVRLQDEVKRNLAKEEKEFTQTVIKTNNQTIMVGGGTRDRAKRVTKLPKKYSNFVQKIGRMPYEKVGPNSGDDEDFESILGKSAVQKLKEDIKKVSELPPPIVEVQIKKPIPIWKKDREDKFLQIKNCKVVLNKLKLNNVATWCMVHNLYTCHCGGKSIFEVKKPPPEQPVIEEAKDYISYASRRQIQKPEHIPPQNEAFENYCARTRALASNFYQARNKSQNYKARYVALRKKNKTETISSNDDNLIVSEDKCAAKPYFNNNEELLVPRQQKRPRVIKVNEILSQNKPETEKSCQVVAAASFIDYDRSFMGLLTPSGEWLEKFHKMLNLNLNTVIRQIRLLEWATLVRRHKAGSLQLWFNNKKYNNIILTENKKRPSKSHLNISYFESNSAGLKNFKLPEIIWSLFKNKLPGVATKDTETYVILVYNGISWEARGTIVLNDTSEMCKQRLGNKKTPTSILNPVLIYPKSEPNNIVIKSTSAVSVEVVNKTNKTQKTKIKSNKAVEITKIPSPKKETPILAPLPTGFGLNHWFMLILKNDFSVLRISFSNFHIKYTHLVTALQTAQQNKKTVRIRSQDKNADIVGNFGIYALPGFGDRIFFGPYQNEIDHGLETFRYVNGKLVNTKIYNKMRGYTEKYTTGIWYFHSSTVQNNLILEPQNDTPSSGFDCSTEVTSAEKAVKPQIEFVDLTENSDNEQENDQQIDPIFNVLSADFTKKVSGDITIEPIYETNLKTTSISGNKQNDMVINKITEDRAKLTSIVSPGIRKKSANKTVKNRVKQVSNVSPEVEENPTKTTENRIKITSIVSPELEDSFTNETVEDRIKVTSIVPPEVKKNRGRMCRKISEDQVSPEVKIAEDRVKLTPEINPANINRKRKSTNSDVEPPKKQPTLIDSIELDDEDETENLPVKKMPNLNRINTVQNLNQESLKRRKIIYVITNIPGIGYFEIFPSEKKCLKLEINGMERTFPTISMALTWLHQLFRQHIIFIPNSLKVKFSILESSDVPEMPKFNQNYLNGSHLMCEKGIFDICEMSPEDKKNLGIPEESEKLLSEKIASITQKSLKVLSSYLSGNDNKLDINEILLLAPKKMKVLESREHHLIQTKNRLRKQQSELMMQINRLCEDAPDYLKAAVKTQIKSTIDQQENPLKLTALPPGKVQIVDGKISTMPANNYEMIVPITGLQKPVTVVGVPRTPNSLLLSNHRNSHKVVDLTDD